MHKKKLKELILNSDFCSAHKGSDSAGLGGARERFSKLPEVLQVVAPPDVWVITLAELLFPRAYQLNSLNQLS